MTNLPLPSITTAPSGAGNVLSDFLDLSIRHQDIAMGDLLVGCGQDGGAPDQGRARRERLVGRGEVIVRELVGDLRVLCAVRDQPPCQQQGQHDDDRRPPGRKSLGRIHEMSPLEARGE